MVSAELITMPTLAPENRPNYLLFYFHVTNSALRDPIVRGLRANGIMASAHFAPLHQSPYGQQYARHANLAVSERTAKTIILLPIYPHLSERAALYIAKTLKTVYLQLLDSPVTTSEK